MKKAVILLLLAAVAVSAQPKRQSVAVLPTVGDIDGERSKLLTKKVIDIAAKNLPQERFNILRQDQITKMIGGEAELFRVCQERVCIVELAKKTNADYGARCEVTRLEDGLLVLTFELYRVDDEAIVASLIDDKVKNFQGMLASLEKSLPGEFKKMAGASTTREITGGIGSVEYGGGRVHTVILSTIPQGAGLSFNGAPIDGCAKSPCNVELPEGKIRILAALAQYETADTTVTVNSNNQYININLKPNVGVLAIKPAYSGNIGADRGWSLSINGKWASAYENTLSPGNYSVKLSHDCYEEIGFKAGIVKGRNETFDLAQHLKLKTGVLVLYAQRDGLPVSEPVFVNGSPAGQTPFNGYVPVCSEITIGNNGDKVNVAIAHNKTVQHRHIFPATYQPQTPEPSTWGDVSLSGSQRASEPSKTYTVATAAFPPNGGTVSRNPNYSRYHAGTRVTVTASPRAGYAFTGWSGGPVSASNNITVTVEDNLTLTANFKWIPASPVQAEVETVTHEPKPKPKNRDSGGFGWLHTADVGGGLKWDNGEQIAMPYSGNGAYVYIDFVYTEVFVVGLSRGGGNWKSADASRLGSTNVQHTYINFGTFVKYPFGPKIVKLFPLLGVDYEWSISGEINKFNGVDPPDLGSNATSLSAWWFKLGGGIDIGLGQTAYLRTEWLYGWRTANKYEKRSAEKFGATPRPGGGPTLKIGIGWF